MEHPTAFVGTDNQDGSLDRRRKRPFARSLTRSGLLIAALYAHVGCGGATEGASRGPLSSSDGGPDSSSSAGGRAGSLGTGGATNSGGTRAEASGAPSGGVAYGSGGRSSATGGSAGAQDGGACIPLGQPCSSDPCCIDPCCTGYCTSFAMAPDGGRYGGQPICNNPGCRHLGERCGVGSDCCVGGGCSNDGTCVVIRL